MTYARSTFFWFRNNKAPLISYRIKYIKSMRLFLSSLLAFFYLSACNNDKAKPLSQDSTAVHTLIFIDKTSSVDVSKAFVANKYESTIKEAIAQNIRKEGDKLEIYFVHENTAKGRSLSLSSRTSLENTEGLNDTDLEASKTNYEMSLKKEQNLFIRQALSKLHQQNTQSSNRETNISAAIPIVSDALNAGSETRVYFLSDMIESVSTGRDFHKNPPKDITEAQKWAEEDIKKWTNVNLSGSEINMILPFEPTTSSAENNPAVTEYWKFLFTNLGSNMVLEY